MSTSFYIWKKSYEPQDRSTWTVSAIPVRQKPAYEPNLKFKKPFWNVNKNLGAFHISKEHMEHQ